MNYLRAIKSLSSVLKPDRRLDSACRTTLKQVTWRSALFPFSGRSRSARSGYGKTRTGPFAQSKLWVVNPTSNRHRDLGQLMVWSCLSRGSLETHTFFLFFFQCVGWCNDGRIPLPLKCDWVWQKLITYYVHWMHHGWNRQGICSHEDDHLITDPTSGTSRVPLNNSLNTYVL